LRAGDVDMIEAVPTRDGAALARDPSIAVWRGPGSLLLYVTLDVARARAPGVSDLAGRPLDRNPLQMQGSAALCHSPSTARRSGSA
jgi:peptide/nickel transport system substrate-binding protein